MELPHIVTLINILDKHVSVAHLYGVLYSSSKRITQDNTGTKVLDEITVQVPLNVRSSVDLGFRLPVTWRSLPVKDRDNSFTLMKDIIVIKGEIDISTLTSIDLGYLKSNFNDVSVVTRVDTIDWGSEMLRHWKVVCK